VAQNERPDKEKAPCCAHGAKLHKLRPQSVGEREARQASVQPHHESMGMAGGPAQAAMKQNSFSIAKRIREQCELPMSKRYFLLVLATYCNSKGECWPSNSELARALRTGKRWPRQALHELVHDGDIEIVANPHGGRGKKRVLRLAKYLEQKVAQASATFPTQKVAVPGTKGGSRATVKVARPTYEERTRTINNDQEQPIDSKAVGSSLARDFDQATAELSKKFSVGYYQSHPAWTTFRDYCTSRGGKPTASGFDKWLPQHEAYERKRRKQSESPRNIGTANEGRGWQYRGVGKVVEGEFGCLLNGKFHARAEAIRMGTDNPKLVTQFKDAVLKPDGTIQIL
jgi:hypothetical protein